MIVDKNAKEPKIVEGSGTEVILAAGSEYSISCKWFTREAN